MDITDCTIAINGKTFAVSSVKITVNPTLIAVPILPISSEFSATLATMTDEIIASLGIPSHFFGTPPKATSIDLSALAAQLAGELGTDGASCVRFNSEGGIRQPSTN